MPGIQISGLLANSAFDWKSIVDQLVAVSGRPIATLTAQKDLNQQKNDALETLKTTLTDLQDSIQAMRADEVFSARTVSSDTANTTWKSSSVTGAALGSYEFAIEQLATAAKIQGAADIADGLATTTDVSGVKLATMRTATAVKAGTFTVNGQQITVALTDSLQDVLDEIALATGDVTGSYNEATDKISLTRASGELLLGAANDTSNFLAVLKLANTGGSTSTSTAALGTLKTTAAIASAGLATAITAVDGGGDGTFSINGVAIDYNVNDDTLGAILSRITNSTAGVAATYDSANDRVVLANKSTGDTGITLAESAGGLLGALGLATAGGGTFVRGANAEFRVNDGALLSSASNTLEAAAHGIAGLSVTVNSATTQTLQVESDAATMNASIQDFLAKFNAVQEFVETNTKITVSGSSVSRALLADNREIEEWARQLQRLAFDEVAGLTGTVTRLDRLGIDFNSISGRLVVKDSGKLATALGDRPEEVEKFFLQASTGFVPKMYGYLSSAIQSDRTQQDNLSRRNVELDRQIATLQSRLDAERELLTSSFIRMLDAQSAAQSQNTYLTNAFFRDNSNN